jgi:enoyl-[acyl-carrier protein] reductase II
MKKLTPVRLIRNEFCKQIQEAEDNCATVGELEDILGRARAKQGMFEGDLEAGELEIGQVSSIIKEIKPAQEIVREVWDEFVQTAQRPFAF